MDTNNKKSDFIGIGAARSGTTWIYHCLYEHPEVCLAPKEIALFLQEKEWDFGKYAPNKKYGEFSVAYLNDKNVPQKIYRKNPGMKLIACLRNPVNRAFSNYLFNIKDGWEKHTNSFEKSIEQNSNNYLDYGRYASHLKKYLNLFPKEQILILIYEDINKNPLAFIQKIYKFIEVDPNFIPRQSLRKKINESRIVKSVRVEKILYKTASLISRTGLHKLWWKIKNSWVMDFILQQNKKSTNIKINEKTREFLKKYYKNDIKELEKIINRKLTEWR